MPAFFFLKASTVYYPTCAPPRRRAPRRASFLQAGRSGPRLLSGKMCRVGEAMGGRFPADALPSHMLPRDLAKLQDLFPTAPTSILQAELQVRVCARACVHAWVAGWGKRRRVVSPRRVQCTNSASRGPLSARQVTGSAQFAMDTLMTDKIHQEVLDLDPVPVALRGYLVKSDPGGRNFTRRCRWPSW